VSDKERKSRPMLKIVILIAVLSLAFVIFHMTCRLESVTITGSSYYTAEELKEKLITEKTDSYALLLYLRAKLFGFSEIPFIEKADAELVDKNSVRIVLYDKAVIGCVKTMGRYMHFDRDGIVVESSEERLEGVPEVTGLEFEEIVLYEKLEIKREALFDRMLEITMLINKNKLPVETVEFDKNSAVKLILENAEVLLGKQKNYDLQINNFAAILEAAGEEKLMFDMRNYTEENREVTAKKLE